MFRIARGRKFTRFFIWSVRALPRVFGAYAYLVPSYIVRDLVVTTLAKLFLVATYNRPTLEIASTPHISIPGLSSRQVYSSH